MGAFKYIKRSFENAFKNRSEEYRKRLRLWNSQSSVFRVEKPSNPVRAHELGYKATRDFIIVRVRTRRGKYNRSKPDLGRKPAKNRANENPGKPWQWFAERNALRFHRNLKLVNSYWVGEDGAGQYYEVILKNELDSSPKRIVKPQPPKTVKAVKKA